LGAAHNVEMKMVHTLTALWTIVDDYPISILLRIFICQPLCIQTDLY
jgi:hypothetical protein